MSEYSYNTKFIRPLTATMVIDRRRGGTKFNRPGRKGLPPRMKPVKKFPKPGMKPKPGSGGRRYPPGSMAANPNRPAGGGIVPRHPANPIYTP